MTLWLTGAIGLVPCLAIACWVAATVDVASRLVAVEFATSIGIIVLVMMSFAFEAPSAIDLPLALALLTLPGTLVFAHCLERWL